MEITSAIEALTALAQESRLKVFRLLVRQGQAGMAAGDIARALSVPNNTMSSHLATLPARGWSARAKRAARSSTRSICQGPATLLSFLLEDCCRGKPQLCASLIESTLADCCPAPEECCQAERRSKQRERTR